MTASSVRVGRIVNGLVDAAVEPLYRRYDRPLVVYLHGASSTASEAVAGDTIAPTVGALMRQIVRAGYSVVAPTATSLWGNATARSRLAAAIRWGDEKLGTNGQAPILFGVSHGAAWALNAVGAGVPASAVLTAVPAVDVDAVRERNDFGARAAIDAAWGVTYPAALPTGADPAADPARIGATPFWAWYGDDDAIVEPGEVTAYAAAVADGHAISVGPFDHATSIPQIPADDVVDVLSRYGS